MFLMLNVKQAYIGRGHLHSHCLKQRCKTRILQHRGIIQILLCVQLDHYSEAVELVLFFCVSDTPTVSNISLYMSFVNAKTLLSPQNKYMQLILESHRSGHTKGTMIQFSQTQCSNRKVSQHFICFLLLLLLLFWFWFFKAFYNQRRNSRSRHFPTTVVDI